MNKKIQFPILLASALLFAGCTTTPQFQSGPDAELTHDGLTRVDKTIMDVVWARTDIDLTTYSKIRFKAVGVEYRPVKGPYSGRAGTGSTKRPMQDEFALNEDQKKQVAEEIGSAFLEELARSDAYELVDESGPDVLTLYVGLLDVVSRVPPDSVGRSIVLLDSVGEATLLMELRDSMSDAIYLRAVDRRAAADIFEMTRSTPVSNRAEVRRLGRYWAGLVRDGLEKLIVKE
ncbi:MAG: DUF3313 family protein [Woeseiaceae bacterium]